MGKTFYRWKILISDAFNKIPTIILIPGILLGSFLIAVFLIWTGVRLAPVSFKELSDPYKTEGKANRAGSSDNANSNSESSGGDSTRAETERDWNYDSENLGAGNFNVNGGGKESGNMSGGQSSNSAQSNSNVNSTAPDSSNSGASGETAESTKKASGNSSSTELEVENEVTSSSSSTSGSAQGESTSGDCTYPEGDVNRWWSKATKIQRECYIKKHGLPDFSKNGPYFCDYQNSEDCYYR